MPKKLEDPYDFMVCVEPSAPWIRLEPKEHAERMQRDCQEIKQQIRRHIDGVGHVYIQCSQDYVCEFCGYKWGYPDSDYNGGCCDEDEKNNPEYKQSPTD